MRVRGALRRASDHPSPWNFDEQMPKHISEIIRYAWEQAEQCRELAKGADTEDGRAQLHAMECTWTRLAGCYHFLKQLNKMH